MSVRPFRTPIRGILLLEEGARTREIDHIAAFLATYLSANCFELNPEGISGALRAPQNANSWQIRRIV